MTDCILKQGIDHLFEQGIGIDLETPKIISQDHITKIDRVGKEGYNVFQVLPLGAVQPDVLVILGELDHVADRFGGFFLMLDKFQHLLVI